MNAEITPGEIDDRPQGDAAASRRTAAHELSPVAEPIPSILDRVINFGGVSAWQAIGWAVTLVVALALRLVQLDGWALSAGEASRAYDAWVLFRGQPSLSGEAIPNSGALLLLLEETSFFLFGATDVTARLVPALAGLAVVALSLALRRWVGDAAALGMAALAAISPALVYASRVISPEIVVAALSLAFVACLVRLGDLGATRNIRGAAVALGVTAGAAFTAGPSAITVALTLAVGFAIAATTAPQGYVRRGLRALRGESPVFFLAAVLTAILLFTRFLSYPAGIAGAGESLTAWWRLLAAESSGQPVQLFLLALFIYEPIAVLLAIVAVIRKRHVRDDAVPLFAGWAVAAFTIWSFSAGRQPVHTVHVVLPLVLLAGIALGTVWQEIDWHEVWHGGGGILALVFLGIVTGLAAVGVLLTRVDERGGGVAAALPPVAVLCLVVVPLAYLAWRLSTEDGGRVSEQETGDGGREAEGGWREADGGSDGQPLLIALFVASLLLGAFGLRSAILLSQDRADLGTELLAQRTATLGTLPSVERLLRLARDVGIDEGSARDPTGSHSLSIALERDVRWPYVWYFREFPELSVVDPGTGTTTSAEVVIAATEDELTDAGYALQSWPWLNTVPPQYAEPDMPAILRAAINPARWLEVWRYLLFREGIALPEPETAAVGLTPELAGRVMVATGPFDLSDRPGPGAEPGQFKDPIGVAVGPDGVIAVVDSGNARVQRFDGDGGFLGIWGGAESEDGVSFTRTANGLGPTGITITPDGVTWVADTWGHRVVALDANGAVVQSIGAETVDTGDDPARVDEAGGRFFGPRAIAVGDGAIYVVDTGNERVQQFSRDGAFVNAWGGYGTAPDRLIEPVGIALGADGNVYVADSGNARIAIFTPAGEPVAQWPVPDWPAPDPGGLPPAFQPYLAFDAEGNLYATASNAGQVLVLDREGAIVDRITQAEGERLAQPIGVAVSPDDEVLFSDVGHDAVLAYTPPRALTSEDFDFEDTGISTGP